MIGLFSDIDYDYDYIMARALRSYRQHREREKADTRKIQMRADFIKRHYPRPKTAPSSRLTAAMRPQKLFRRLDSVLVPKVPVDAISEVQRANVSEEEIDRYRVKSGIFGQTAKLGQPPCSFHSSVIGIKIN